MLVILIVFVILYSVFKYISLYVLIFNLVILVYQVKLN